MDREEEAGEAALKWTATQYHKIHPEDAFVEGVKWADKNPKPVSLEEFSTQAMARRFQDA